MLGDDALVAGDGGRRSSGAVGQPDTQASAAEATAVPEYIKINNTLFLDGDDAQPVLVKYIGWTRFNNKGIWVGVAFGEPNGKHGGYVNGHRYFNCKPKHGLFVRPGRLTEMPGDVAAIPVPKKSTQAIKRVVRPPTISGRSKAAPERSHPVLGPKRVSVTKRKQVRWYMDPQGRRFTTLKEYDPFGRRTQVVGEGGDPSDLASGTKLAQLEARVIAEEGVTREAAHRAEMTAREAAAAAQETYTVTAENSMRLSQAVLDLQRAEKERNLRESSDIAAQRDAAQRELERESSARHSAESAAAAATEAAREAAAEAARDVVQREMAALESAQQAAREAAAADAAHQQALVKAAADEQAARDDAKREKMAADPSATGMSEDEDDDKGEIDADVDAWFWSKVRQKPAENVAPAATAGPAETAGQPRRVSQLAPTTLPAVSTVEGCAAIAKGLKASAIDEDWGLVRDLLVDRCMELVVTQEMLKRSGIGKVVGRLRQAPNPGVVFAAEEVIDGWKFQVTLDKPEAGPKQKKKALTSTPNEGASSSDDERPDSSFLTRVSRRAGLLNDEANTRDHDDAEIEEIDAEIAYAESPDDSASESPDPDEFVAVSTLLRCEALVDRIKTLTLAKKWRRLHRLLQEQVAVLLVTEDDLRRSGIGRVLAKVVRHAEVPEVGVLAADIIEDWKEKVNHRDPTEERELEAERIEREKFQQFINLAPASLGIQSSEVREGESITGVGGAQQKAAAPVYYEKEFELVRGIRRKPLGFELTLGSPNSGGTAAVVGKVVPNGLADKAARAGCAIEEHDEVVSVNGTKLSACTREEAMALFKSAAVKLTLRSIMPGSEVAGDDDGGDDGLYSTSAVPLFHKVLPSDFVTLA
eukprot:m.133155 g.133155  ORF g.133155 m.133155 type:complete len:872 (+) comp22485_c0_seq1:51-2666(+)